jgi:hypothetical protein
MAGDDCLDRGTSTAVDAGSTVCVAIHRYVKVTRPCSTNVYGQLLSKAHVIGGRQSGNRKHCTTDHDGIEIQRFGNAIVLRGRSTSKALASYRTTNREACDETAICFNPVVGSRFGRFC